jgi:cysteine desulfurase/selenocysteine lyase
VLEKIRSFYAESNSNIHRGLHFLSERAAEQYESARISVQHFINAAHPYEVIFTHGTTESINGVAQGLGNGLVNAGDEVLVTEMEHHSNFVPWQTLCAHKGATLKALLIDDDGALRLEQLDSLITARTKLIAVSYVSNALGTVNPVKEVISRAHAHDIPVLVDAAQAIQHMPIDVRELDCDFLAFSGHKMYAETGIGVLYGKESWLERMPPWHCGGGMISSVRLDTTSYAELPLKFEAGTPHIAGASSLEAAIAYMEDIGLGSIMEHEQDLVEYALRELSRGKGLRLYGTRPRSGLVSFNLDAASPYDVGMILDKLGIAIRAGTHCAEPVMRHFGIGGTVRASFALYNTREEVDKLVEGVEKARGMLI